MVQLCRTLFSFLQYCDSALQEAWSKTRPYYLGIDFWQDIDCGTPFHNEKCGTTYQWRFSIKKRRGKCVKGEALTSATKGILIKWRLAFSRCLTPSQTSELWYHARTSRVQHGVRKFITMLIRGAEAAADNNDISTVYHIIEELAGGHKSFDSPVRDVNGRLLIHDIEQRCTSPNLHMPSFPKNRNTDCSCK